MSNKTPQSY